MISVIIPVYNCDNYLKVCVNSLLNQSYKDFEIILIDDGSTDVSKTICDEYDKAYECIHAIHTSNMGPSHARNLGLENAKGEFVAFCDSDDYCEKEYLQTLYDLIKQNADISCCSYFDFKESSSGKPSNHDNEIRRITGDERLKQINCNKWISGFLWNKLFKKSIIENNKLLFDEKIFVQEDLLFVTNYLIFCGDLLVTDNELYGYRTSTNSLSHQNQVNNKQFSMIYANEEMYKLIKSFGSEEISTIYWSNLMKKYSYFFKDIFLHKQYRKNWWPIIKQGYLQYNKDYKNDKLFFNKKEFFYYRLLNIFSKLM